MPQSMTLILPIAPRAESNGYGVEFTATEAYWRIVAPAGTDPIRTTTVFGGGIGHVNVRTSTDTRPDPQPPAWFVAAVDEFLAGAR